MKKLFGSVMVSVVFSAIVAITLAGEEYIFPVGLIAVDNLWKAEEGWPFDISDELLVDLRSKGVEMVNLNGIYQLMYPGHQGQVKFDTVMHDVDTLGKKLARAAPLGSWSLPA